jgi:hypothetical protein
MRRLVLVGAVCAVLLAGCLDPRPGFEDPLATPLSAINLDPAFLQVEGLGLAPGTVGRTNPVVWPLLNIPNGDNHLSQQLVDGSGEYIGWVSVFLFESGEDLESAFQALSGNAAGFETSGVASVGERSLAYDENGRHGIAFVQCRALINILVGRSTPIDAVVAYGAALAGRLPSPVCP